MHTTVFAATERAVADLLRLGSLPRSHSAALPNQNRANKGLVQMRSSLQQPFTRESRVQRRVFYERARNYVASLLRGEYSRF